MPTPFDNDRSARFMRDLLEINFPGTGLRVFQIIFVPSGFRVIEMMTEADELAFVEKNGVGKPTNKARILSGPAAVELDLGFDDDDSFAAFIDGIDYDWIPVPAIPVALTGPAAWGHFCVGALDPDFPDQAGKKKHRLAQRCMRKFIDMFASSDSVRDVSWRTNLAARMRRQRLRAMRRVRTMRNPA